MSSDPMPSSAVEAEQPNLKQAAPSESKVPEPAKSDGGLDRRADVDAKQSWAAELLNRHQAELLFVLEQANFAWLTSGAATRGLMSPEEHPLLCYSATQRWLVCGNFESQRMFDEELDGLGFLLKEWPWHARRDRVVADLVRSRTVIADQAVDNAKVVGDDLRAARLALSTYEQACLKQLGKLVVHCLEATGRSATSGDTERELAGQIAHRLLRYGVTPVNVSVSGDGRSRSYRRHGYTGLPVNRFGVLSATGRKYGLYVTAARSFHFGQVDDALKAEQLAACRVAATYAASCWPDAMPRDILTAAQRVYKLNNFEHEWELSPQGYVTGRAPVEVRLDPSTKDELRQNYAVTWGPAVGSAVCQDTLLVTEAGPVAITPTVNWGTATIKVAGAEFTCPYILER